MPKERSIFNRYVCEKIKEKKSNSLNPLNFSNELIISRNDFRKMLGWFNVPYYIQTRVITEMEETGLIKVKDKRNIILISQKKKDPDWFA